MQIIDPVCMYEQKRGGSGHINHRGCIDGYIKDAKLQIVRQGGKYNILAPLAKYKLPCLFAKGGK